MKIENNLPLKIRIEFTETTKTWEGGVFLKHAKVCLYRTTYARSAAGRPDQPWKVTHKVDMHGTLDAIPEFFKSAYPHAFSGCDWGAKDFLQFKQRFLCCVRGFMVDYAALHGVLLVPVNYGEDVWMPDLVCKLGQVLQQRRPKRHEMFRIREFFAQNWIAKKLHECDRNELAALVIKELAIDKSPKTIWAVAERCGFLSNRQPGPKYRPPVVHK